MYKLLTLQGANWVLDSRDLTLDQAQARYAELKSFYDKLQIVKMDSQNTPGYSDPV